MPRAKKKSGGTSGRRKVNRSSAKAKSKPETEFAMTAEVPAFDEHSAETGAAQPEQDLECLMLPDCLDASAAPSLKDMLLARRGNAIVVDASQVNRVGAQSLQVLVAAARTWKADQQSYRVTNASAELLETLALIGLPPDDLLLEGSHQ
jgi:anti-anti-sigma regulatory factor